MNNHFTMVEKYPQNKKSSIAIRPYFDPSIENMGLEKYGLCLHDGAFHEEELACVEQNGIMRFITGLNEFAPDIKRLPPDLQESRIKQIRATVASLEKDLAGNVLDPTDKEFWNKVKLLRPDNFEYWSKIKLRCSNEPTFLDPESDPVDLIKLYAIESGGFSMVAPNLETARKMSKAPKFYLDKLEDTASTVTEVSKLRNKAGAELEKLFTKNQNKLFYVAKNCDPMPSQYRKSTPHDIIYANMDRFIQGELVDRNKKRCAEQFLDVCSMDMETLKIRAMVKDATYYKIIAPKADGFVYYMEKGAMLGRTFTDCIEFLKAPLNEEILIEITKKVEVYWNQ